jgi:hypothetical protein
VSAGKGIKFQKRVERPIIIKNWEKKKNPTPKKSIINYCTADVDGIKPDLSNGSGPEQTKRL